MPEYAYDLATDSWFGMDGADDLTVTSSPDRPTGPNIVPYETISGSGNLSTKIDSVGSTKEVSFDEGAFFFTDFAINSGVYGVMMLQAAGIRGSGPDFTTFRMVPSSSTQAAKVPASNPPTSNGQVNPLWYVRAGWEGLSTTRHLSGFTLEGTSQGHLYNGLNLYRLVAGSVVEDIRVTGIPGDLSREPGETFSVSAYNCTGVSGNPVILRRVETDGRDTGGSQVAASGIGVNFGGRLLLEDCNSHHMAQAHGYALYTCSNLDFVRCKATNTTLNGFNFENVSGAVTLDRCTTTSNGSHHIGIFTNTGNATYTITDPVYDGAKLKIRLTGYNGGARTQVQSDIKLYVGGVERADLIQWTLT